MREDSGLRCFATAMKTLQGRGNTDLLNSPKQLCLSKEDNNKSSSIASAGTWDTCAAHFKLKHLLALIKGELRSREVDAPYVTVHGGLQGSWDKLRALEHKSLMTGRFWPPRPMTCRLG